MVKRKTLFKWTILKRHSTTIYILLTASVFIVLLSLISSAFPLNQPKGVSVPASHSSLASEQPTQSLVAKPQFDIEVLYAYVGRGPVEAPHSHFDGVLMYPRSQYPSIVYFNITHLSNSVTESCDAKMEVYLIQITSDTGCTENFTYVEATNYNPAFSDLNALSSRIHDLIEPDTTLGPYGFFSFNLTTNQSILGHRVGSIGSYTSNPSGLGLWSAGEPNTITVSIRRIGWITSNGISSSTIRDASSETIAQVQLEKFGDGFIYNTIVSQRKLSQIDLYLPPIPQN